MIHSSKPTLHIIHIILIHPQSGYSSDHYLNLVLFCEILKSGEGRTDGRTDNTCENSDHYRPWLWVDQNDVDNYKGNKKKLGNLKFFMPHFIDVGFKNLLLKVDVFWVNSSENNFGTSLTQRQERERAVRLEGKKFKPFARNMNEKAAVLRCQRCQVKVSKPVCYSK